MLTIMHSEPCCSGKFTLDMALKDMEAAAAAKGKAVSLKEVQDFSRLFTECFNAVDSKQLVPMIRTQYMRTAFQVCAGRSSLQICFYCTVRISFDTNLCIIREENSAFHTVFTPSPLCTMCLFVPLSYTDSVSFHRVHQLGHKSVHSEGEQPAFSTHPSCCSPTSLAYGHVPLYATDSI